MDAGQRQVRFCRSGDGTRIAWSRHGSGPPLVVDTCWLSHLQHDWDSPVWRHYLHGLGSFATTVRYDERGFGMSDRAVTDFSFEQRIADLAAVVDAAGLERFSLLGMAQGGQVAIAYAARHPERVSRLVLHSCYATMMTTPEDEALEAAFVQLIKVGWARPESEFRRVFTSMMIPGATPEQMTWLDDLQRICTTTENAVAFRAQRYGIDVSELAATLDLPTLVLHARAERVNSFEEGLRLASLIPGARLVPLDSVNHILLGDEPAFQVFLGETENFLRDGVSSPPAPSIGRLTPRERDVLRCAATGADNESIATSLSLSVRTVERHLQNAYTKLGVTGRSARAAAVAAILS